MSNLSEEEKKAIAHLEFLLDDGILASEDEPHIEIILNLIEKQQAEIEQLKYSITKATKIIDEYANETEKDTKKLIEYQENFLRELLEEGK